MIFFNLQIDTVNKGNCQLVSVNQVKIRVFCYCCINVNSSNLFKKRHQNTRLLALSIYNSSRLPEKTMKNGKAMSMGKAYRGECSLRMFGL